MATSPYRDLPSKKFLTHLVIPSVILAVLGFMCVGVAANSPYFQEASGPTAVPSFLEASLGVYQLTAKRVSNLPSICVFGEKENDFQRKQCDLFWTDLARTGGLALAPFILVGLFLFLNLEVLKGFYFKLSKKIEKDKANFGGTVTQPPEAPEDAFSWYFCVQPITVELANKTQLKVYHSSLLPVPIAGQTLALFDAGEHFGKKRYLGVVYAPHIAVVKGA